MHRRLNSYFLEINQLHMHKKDADMAFLDDIFAKQKEENNIML